MDSLGVKSGNGRARVFILERLSRGGVVSQSKEQMGQDEK